MNTLLLILFSIICDTTSLQVTSQDTISASLTNDTSIVAQDSIPVMRVELTPDSVFIQRMQQLPYVVELPYNTIVRRYILRYLYHSPKQVASLLQKEQYYMPIFWDVLSQYELPFEWERNFQLLYLYCSD